MSKSKKKVFREDFSLEELGLNFLETKEKEANTYKAYQSDLKFFLNSFDSLDQLNNLNNLRDLKLGLKENYDQKTFLRRWSTLREFLRFCEEREQISRSLILDLAFYLEESEEQRKKVLSESLQQKKRLLERVCQSPDSLRDRALLWFLYSTGIRVSELSKFAFLKNLNLASAEFYLPERTTFLSSQAKLTLESYLETRKTLSLEEPIFLSNSSVDLLKESYVYQVFQRACQGVGLKSKISDLRDSLILRLISEKASIKQIQYLLGIKSRKTLEPLLKVLSESANSSQN